jgi:hypothetical protein
VHHDEREVTRTGAARVGDRSGQPGASEAGTKGRGSRSASDQWCSEPVARHAHHVDGGRELDEHLAAHAARRRGHVGVGGEHQSSKARCPPATAAATAPRSAQIPAGYDAFSTLHPDAIAPSAVSSAAPTRNCEYGA